ncbi:hypothetical protein AB0M36_07425 [Actinoplanes sp. NPDC051346]|uniref:hypothetical protein n=1 Tax=Actinoplanes sp. NPDC051346 TaxID=3155048 RepID=UPI00343CEB34
MSAAYGGYRWLVRAYPPGPRRDELLDTMIMSAEGAGRERPAGQEILDVLRRAPRARLGRPGSIGVVVAAIAIALLTAFVSASLVLLIAGETDRPLPNNAELTAIAGVVTPGLPVTMVDRHEGPHIDGNGEGAPGYVQYRTGTTTGSAGIVTESAARLRAAGWRVADADSQGLTAMKDGLLMNLSAGLYLEGEAVEVRIRRAEPSRLAAVTVTFLAGLVVGWLFTGWASRRTAHHPAASHGLGHLLFLSLITITPLAFSVTSEYLAIVTRGFSDSDKPVWIWLNPHQEMAIFWFPLALAACVAAVILTVCRPTRIAPPVRADVMPRS